MKIILFILLVLGIGLIVAITAFCITSFYISLRRKTKKSYCFRDTRPEHHPRRDYDLVVTQPVRSDNE